MNIFSKDSFFSYIFLFFTLALLATTIAGVVGGYAGFLTESVYSDEQPLESGVKGNYIGPAVSLLETGTLTFNRRDGRLYLGEGQRGPFYSFILAGTFVIFGKIIGASIVVSFLLHVVCAVLIWRISRRFLPHPWSAVPALVYVVFWEAIAFIWWWWWHYEFYVLALGLGFFLEAIRYQEKPKISRLFVASFLYALWTIDKANMLYFYPVVIGYFFVVQRVQKLSWKTISLHMGAFLLISLVFVGGWSWRNYRELGTWQLGAGRGITLMRRASQIDFTKEQIVSALLSVTVGDYLGSKVYSGFPPDGRPRFWEKSVDDRWSLGYHNTWFHTSRDGRRIGRIEADEELYQDAVKKVKERPMKFLLTSSIQFFRLNSPLYPRRDGDIMPLFMGAPGIPGGIKVVLLIGIRLIWFSFLVLVFLGGVIMVRKKSLLSALIILFILYLNTIQSLVTHGEVRYLFSVMPFYFLLAIVAVETIVRRQKGRKGSVVF